MDRVLRDTPQTISATFYDDDTVTDPGTVTIKVSREDGTVLVAAGTATSGTGATRTFNLTTTHTASLDVLTARWTSSTLGTIETTVEVVGGFLFSLAEARSLKPLDNTTNYTVDALKAARVRAEDALEHACGGVAFVPRYFRETVEGTGRRELQLRTVRPLTITAATVDGVALTTDEIADLTLRRSGVLVRPSGWHGRVEVKGTAGFPVVPGRVSRAALLLAKRYAVDSPVNDRATSLTNEDGTTQMFVTAGVRGAVFDVPEANAVVMDYGVLGVA